jgi:hypothetical protein
MSKEGEHALMKNIITSSGRMVGVCPRIGGRGGKAFNKNYRRRVEAFINVQGWGKPFNKKLLLQGGGD